MMEREITYEQWSDRVRQLIESRSYAHAIGALQMLVWIHAPDEAWPRIMQTLNTAFPVPKCSQERCNEPVVGEDGLCEHHDRLANPDYGRDC